MTTILSDWPSALPSTLLADLHARYAEPQRTYHTWRHIDELLALFGEVEDRLANPRAVLFAILFHDAVYDPAASDSEKRSAILLREKAAGLLDPKSLALAQTMVQATIHHELPPELVATNRSDAAHFLDMDLAILGTSPERFAEYDGQIRQEYAHVPDDAFRTGRAAVLQRFSERSQLYFSEWGRARFEDRARENLSLALAVGA